MAYYGTTSATAHQLYRIFWDVVEKLDDHGFYVEYLMMDGASSNRYIYLLLIQHSIRFYVLLLLLLYALRTIINNDSLHT